MFILYCLSFLPFLLPPLPAATNTTTAPSTPRIQQTHTAAGSQHHHQQGANTQSHQAATNTPLFDV